MEHLVLAPPLHLNSDNSEAAGGAAIPSRKGTWKIDSWRGGLLVEVRTGTMPRAPGSKEGVGAGAMGSLRPSEGRSVDVGELVSG